MLKGLALVAGVLLSPALLVSAGFGLDAEPKKANKYQATLVNGYEECTTPSETTAGALPLPACPAVDSSGGTCNFSDKGLGKVLAKAKEDVSLKILAKNLENCDGQSLQAVASIKVSTNNCSVSARCTTVTLENFPVPGATCVVDKGKCLIKGTVNEFAPGTLTTGENTSIRIGTVGLLAGTASIATGGVLVP